VETVLEKVISLDFTIEGSGTRYLTTREHSSLVLDLQEQLWFWNSKDLLHKTPEEYLILIKGFTKSKAKEFVQELQYVPQSSFKLQTKDDGVVVPNERLVDVFWKNGAKDREYWYKRCLTDRIIDSFKLGKFDGFSMLPIYMDNKFMNFQCRRDLPEKKIRPWYRGVGPLMFNSSILDISDTVYITEGPIDAILLMQNGFPAMSHTGGSGGWKKEWFRYFMRVKRVYYIADNDEAGIAASHSISDSLGKEKVKIVRFSDFPEKYDTVDFFRDGHTVKEFKELVNQSRFSYELKRSNIYGQKKH